MDEIRPWNKRYVAILAVACSLILVGGWLARPREIPHRPAPVPSETELEQLARRAERRSLDSMAKYFAGIAREVDSSIAHIRGAAVSGVAGDDKRIVTTPWPNSTSAAPVAAVAASGDLAGVPTVWGPNLPLAAIAVPPGLAGLTPARRALARPQPGDWVVAVWRTDQEPTFAAGNFRQSASIMCGLDLLQEVVSSLSFTSGMAGGGLFDGDGGLLAIILPCRDRLAAIAIGSVQTVLQRHDTVPQRLLGRYGLALGPLSEPEISYFKAADGVLVREVWTGYAGDAAGFRPGDIITHLSGTPVGKTDDLRTLATLLHEPVELTVQRRSKRLTISLSPESLEVAWAAPGGAVTWDAPQAFRIESVRPGSGAAAAGIEAGDAIIRIDQADPRNVAQVRRLFGPDQRSPAWIEVQRGARRLGMLVQ